jgi:heat shock protein HtpX
MWEAIHSNARKSWALILLLGLLLLALGGVVGGAWVGRDGIVFGLMITGVLWLVMTVVAITQGGNILLALSGAKEVKHDDAPQLFNLVEEMRIAATLPSMPQVFIMESAAPNAFAVGTPDHAAVAVTTGLLSVLSRDELQGVIAHEVGHIRNQDTRFMTIAGVMLGTIVILADIFVRSMFFGGGQRRSSRSDRGGGQLQLILFVLAIVLAILAPILANLLYLACSRSREYLADASAALFTRYPEGLASALEKIAGSAAKMENASRVTAPMYIINPLAAKGRGGSSWFSTHPDTAERVRILRAMGGAGLTDYEQAYRAAKGGRGLIGDATLRSEGELAMRGIRPVDAAAGDRRQRTREANDILLRANQFRFISCACGLRLKLPPEFAGPTVKCPRCGATHNATSAKAG